ncbi:hypothetical protein [Lysinibacillus sp. K60]|uniref:hypothetical protein n=1 Tax=Lysinibacillus sp. K60 TaxID=2720027 RepID=UPI001C8B9615|nr:hypothetical protein [Lysinibacillus sp. K60]MBX8946032.1 hypothetical protein [Lysinibacillus sp. K60]
MGMRANEVFSHVIEMIAFHKDLQEMNDVNQVQLIQIAFKTPEIGYLHTGDLYIIDKKGVTVTTTKKHRFLWKQIWPYLKTAKKQSFLF